MPAETPPPADAPRIELFGAPRLRAGAVYELRPERRVQLLAYLAAHDGAAVPRDAVAALFWPDRSAADARRNLRKVVHDAHALPGAQGLVATEHTLCWPVASDLADFRRAVREGRLAEALALRRGPAFGDLDRAELPALADWFVAERARWQQAWHGAALQRLQAVDEAERVRLAGELLLADPLDELALDALVGALVALGRAPEADAAYRRYARALADDLGIAPAQALRARLVLPAGNAAARRSASVTPVASASAFVGRRAELVELARLLAQPDCRALTVLGPGGAGKSRLAQQVLAGPAAGFEPGWCWIALEDAVDVDGALARIAQRLDLSPGPADDLAAALLARMGDDRWRLVLDNAEHLPGLPAVLQRLLDGAAGLQLLVTSRARLHLAGEWVLPLAGLAVPDDDSRDAAAAPSFDALRLFELRARAARPDFDLAHALDAAIAVVESVGGLPLAIELAAAWVRLLPLPEIARELQRSVDLLERDPASTSVPARPEHASLRRVLDQAWALLAPSERKALAALSAFRGGFDAAAARAVAGCTLPLLSALVDHSLVAAGEGGRFALHPLVAAHAAERLASDPAAAADACRRHAEEMAARLERLAPCARGDTRVLVAAIDADQANARAAWQTALALGRADLVARMARALWAYFENRGRQREGIELMAPALALPMPGASGALARARVHHGLSMLHHRVGNLAQGEAIARRGADGAEHCGDTEAFVGCLLNAGSCIWQAGDVTAARRWFERAVEVARARDDPQCLAWAEGNLGVALMDLGELDAAQACLQRALDGSRAVGDQYNVAVHLVNLGSLARDRGQFEASRQWLEQARRHCAEHALTAIALYTALNLGHVARRAGDLAGARRAYGEAHDLATRGGSHLLQWSAEIGLARVEVAAGSATEALARLRRVAAAARAKAATPDLAVVAMVYGDALAVLGDQDGATAAWRAARGAGVLPAAQQRWLDERLAASSAAAASATSPTLAATIEALLTP